MALPTGDTWASAVGTGSSINVALDFVFWESSSIKAFKYTTATGVGAAFTDFTVMGGNGSTGMAITTDNHPTTSETVKFYLEMPLEQQESQNEGTGYSATSIERADDKNAQRIKQLSEEIARCVKVPVNETSADDLPAFASRAGKVPSFDENGKLVATISAAPLADVGDAVATAEAAATTATTQAATATTQAGIATTQAGIATTKAAEAAASAATIGQDVSTSGTPTFAGLALTGNADLNSNKITELGDATADTDALNRQSADARYLRLAQALGDIPDKAAARLNLDVFGRGIVRGRSRTPLAEQPGIEPESPMMPVTLTEAEFEALTEYEPRYYDVLGIGTYFGPKRIAWDTDVYDSSTGIHVATTGDDSTGDGSVGNPYLTISKGWDIAVAANGGTVWVHGGEYAENVSGGYFLKNAAAPSSTVTIRGVPGEKVVWTNTATGAYVFRLTGACSNITIRNVTFRQAYASGSGFVYCNDASNALSNLQLIECHFDGAVNRATYFIQIVGAGGSSGVKVKRCSMTASGTGMSTIFSNHAGLEVVGNSFVNTASAVSWFGVRLNAGNSGNIYLNSNYLRGADGDGINQDTAFTGTAAVVARRNEVILTTGGDGLYLYGGSASFPATVDIRRNRISSPSGNGLVVVQAVSGGTMENNRVVAGADRVMNCGADGVGLEPVENVIVRHNHAIGQDAGTTHTLLIGPFSSGITADYNIVDGSDGAHYGLVFKGANSSFTNGIIYGGTDSALYLKGTDTCAVSRCLVVQNQSTVDATLEFQDGSALEPLVDSSVTECIFELTAGKLYDFGAGSTHLSTGNVINSNAYLLSGTATWGTMFASAVTSLAEVRASWAANYDVATNDADSTDE